MNKIMYAICVLCIGVILVNIIGCGAGELKDNAKNAAADAKLARNSVWEKDDNGNVRTALTVSQSVESAVTGKDDAGNTYTVYDKIKQIETDVAAIKKAALAWDPELIKATFEPAFAYVGAADLIVEVNHPLNSYDLKVTKIVDGKPETSALWTADDTKSVVDGLIEYDGNNLEDGEYIITMSDLTDTEGGKARKSLEYRFTVYPDEATASNAAVAAEQAKATPKIAAKTAAPAAAGTTIAGAKPKQEWTSADRLALAREKAMGKKR